MMAANSYTRLTLTMMLLRLFTFSVCLLRALRALGGSARALNWNFHGGCAQPTARRSRAVCGPQFAGCLPGESFLAPANP